MSTYAIVENGIVANVVVWDGGTDWTPPEGSTAVKIGEDDPETGLPLPVVGIGIGCTYSDGVFGPLPPPPDDTGN